MDNEKIIPFTGGSEANAEKAKELREKALAVYDTLVQIEKERSWFIQAELQKPLEDQNLSSISIWENEFEDVRKKSLELDEKILSSFEAEDYFREQARLLEELNQLEQFIKTLSKEDK